MFRKGFAVLLGSAFMLVFPAFADGDASYSDNQSGLMIENNIYVPESPTPIAQVEYEEASAPVSYEVEVASVEPAPAVEKKYKPYVPVEKETSWPVSGTQSDIRIENNINMSNNAGAEAFGFSGGANMDHAYQAPAGFNIYEHQSEMPLMHQEMMMDDGTVVLAASRNSKRKSVDAVRPENYGIQQDFISESLADSSASMNSEQEVLPGDQVELKGSDQVRSWVVTQGQTLRSVLENWAKKEGWDVVWNTSREYPIQASAVFKGRFVDVSSALVRNFGRANPVPYARFYKGNRVLVIQTLEDGNGY